MTRTIKASEIKEGMTVQLQMEVDFVREHRDWPTFFRDDGRSVGLDGDIEVEVLSEPQPEEPTTFGARVVVGGECYLRAQQISDDTIPWLGGPMGRWHRWRELLGRGQVTIIDADPYWTVPEDAPVPERIGKWPKDDTALRKHKWRDRDGDTWTWAEAQAEWECRDHRGVRQVASSRPFSRFAPFTRVTDA